MTTLPSQTWSYQGEIAAQAIPAERLAFLKRTYSHLLGAIAAFTVLCALLVNSPFGQRFAETVLGARFGHVLMLVAFMVVGYIAEKWAMSGRSPRMQYAGLAVYVVAEAIFFTPLLFVAAHYSSPDVIPAAAMTTLAAFTGLSLVVFVTGKDFSFLRGALSLLTFLALGLILASAFFGGLSLGIWFAVAMAAVASGYVLYYTSRILRHYRTDAHIAAALALFAAVALLFWYILQLFMRRD